jgi:hypothetical protein
MTEEKNERQKLFEQINATIRETTWNYVTWSLPDLQALAAQQEEKTESDAESLFATVLSDVEIPIPTKVPSTSLCTEKKSQLRDFLLFEGNEKYSFVFKLQYDSPEESEEGFVLEVDGVEPEQSTLESVTQKIQGLPNRIDAKKVRKAIDTAFGYALTQQEGLLAGNLNRDEYYTVGELHKILHSIDCALGEEAESVPEEIRYLSKLLFDDNLQQRRSKKRISIDPFVMALTTQVEFGGSAPRREQQQAQEDVYRKIIFTALFDKEEAKPEDAGTANQDTIDAWVERKKTSFTEEECNSLLPYISVREMCVAAKKLGEKYANAGFAAYKAFLQTRNQYKEALMAQSAAEIHAEQKAAYETSPVETSAETPSEGTGSPLPETEQAEESAE